MWESGETDMSRAVMALTMKEHGMEEPYVARFASQIHESFLELLLLDNVRQLFYELRVPRSFSWTFLKSTGDL